MAVTKQNTIKDVTDDIVKVASGTGISFIGSFIGKGLWIICQIIIARQFGAEVFGLFIIGLIVLKFSGLVARLGLHSGSLRFVSIYRKCDPGKVKGTLISTIFISFITGILIGILIYFSAGFVAKTIFHNTALVYIIKSFAICIPFLATMMVCTAASRGFHTAKYAVYTREIIQPSVNILLLIIFILLGFSIFGVISAFIISNVIALFAGFIFITRQFSAITDKPTKPVYEVKKLLNYSIPLLFNGFLVFLISWTDKIMLGYMKTAADVGIYRAATQIPLLLYLVLKATNNIYAPSVAEMHHLNQMERLEKLFKTITQWVFFLTLPAAIILVFSAREVMTIFGPDYVEIGSQVLIVLTIAQFVNCITGGSGNNLAMTGKQHLVMINSLVMFIINVILNYFLIPMYGSLGAAIATGISFVLINFVRLLEVYIIYKIHPYSTKYIQGIVCGIIAAITLHILGKYILAYSSLIVVISNTLVVSVIFIASFFIVGVCDEDKLIFNVIANKFKIKYKFAKHNS